MRVVVVADRREGRKRKPADATTRVAVCPLGVPVGALGMTLKALHSRGPPPPPRLLPPPRLPTRPTAAPSTAPLNRIAVDEKKALIIWMLVVLVEEVKMPELTGKFSVVKWGRVGGITMKKE